MEDYTTHIFLEYHQYAFHARIINRRRSVSGILHTLLGVAVCLKLLIQPAVAYASTDGGIRCMNKALKKTKATRIYMKDLSLHTCTIETIAFLKQYYRNPIPLISCIPQLIKLFSELNHGVKSSTVLNKFYPDKTTFLNTDWISEGMSWILRKPPTDKEYLHASTVLKENGNCLFDLSPHGNQH